MCCIDCIEIIELDDLDLDAIAEEDLKTATEQSRKQMILKIRVSD